MSEPYDRFDPNREPLRRAQALFLDVYAREEPKVLADLDQLTEAAKELRQIRERNELFLGPDAWYLSEFVGSFSVFRKRLSKWAFAFRFTVESGDAFVPVPWIMDTALATLGRWTHTRHSARDQWVHRGGFQHEYAEDSTRYEFTFDGPKLDETRRQYEDRVRTWARTISDFLLIERVRLLGKEETRLTEREKSRNASRACWADTVDQDIRLSMIERLARWQAKPDLLLKHVDDRVASAPNLKAQKTAESNASRDLTAAARYIRITRRHGATARRLKDRDSSSHSS